LKFLPTPKTPVVLDKGISQGAELAVGVLVFFGIGALIDWWLGTVPVFMVALTIFGMVGYFVRIYYTYNVVMSELEEKRSQESRGITQ
jgi:F0F1-type ATP synthase assembly protein I